MGYETKLWILRPYGRKTNDFHRVLAMVELNGVAHSKGIGPLLNKIGARSKAIRKKVDHLLTQLEILKEQREEGCASCRPEIDEKILDIEEQLEKKLPYFYPDGDTFTVEDPHGDVLLWSTLDEAEVALKAAQKDWLSGKDPIDYAPFRVALSMVQEFKKDKKGDFIKVVWYGH